MRYMIMTRCREISISTISNNIINEIVNFTYATIKKQLDTDKEYYNNQLKVLIETDNYILVQLNKYEYASCYREYTQID